MDVNSKEVDDRFHPDGALPWRGPGTPPWARIEEAERVASRYCETLDRGLSMFSIDDAVAILLQDHYGPVWVDCRYGRPVENIYVIIAVRT